MSTTQSKNLKPGMVFEKKQSWSWDVGRGGLVLGFPMIRKEPCHDEDNLGITDNKIYESKIFLYLNFKGEITEYYLYDGVWDWVELL